VPGEEKCVKKIIIALISLTALLLTFSCGQSKTQNEVTASYSRAMGGAAYDAMPEPAPMRFRAEMADMDDGAAIPELEDDIVVERKLVKRANIRMRVENLETSDASVSALMEKYNAYAASTNIEENSRYYSLRVPAPFYDTFLADMNGLGRLLNRYENTEDVTLRYYDLEGRLATKKELLKTFQSYLGKANNIEEIMAVEARISELQYDIEGTGIQLRNLINRIDYATIDLHLLGPVTSIPKRTVTLGERIKQLFGSFGGFLSTVAVVIVGIVVYGIPILLLLVLLFWLLFGRIGLIKKLWRVVVTKK
jgi:hypothetical protein